MASLFRLASAGFQSSITDFTDAECSGECSECRSYCLS